MVIVDGGFRGRTLDLPKAKGFIALGFLLTTIIKAMKKLGFLILLTTLTGCVSFFDGSFQSPSFATKDNFRIVATIEGEAQATYILGIGGNLRDGLVNEAKRKMYSGYSLRPNQNLTNITVDTKVTSFFIPIIYQNKRVIVSADVIEFYDDYAKSSIHTDVVSIDNQGETRKKDEVGDNGLSVDKKEAEARKYQRDLERFELITSFAKTKPTTLKIANVRDLKVGDVVSFRSYTEDGVSYIGYGFIESIMNETLKVSAFNALGQEELFEDRFTKFKKVLY